jgi:hypothetical protein
VPHRTPPAAAPEAPTAARVTPPPSNHIEIGAIAQLDVSPGSVIQMPPVAAPSSAGYRMSLTSGRVCAHVEPREVAVAGPFVVAAPGLEVFVIGTRFCVESAAEVTTVQVSEGRVRVARPQLADVFVGVGESLSSSVHAGAAPGPAASVAPTVAPTTAVAGDPVARCAALGNLARRADCYAGLVGADDLAAQNALFSLALLSRDGLHDGPAALSHFRTYLARFPDGALAAEARQSLIAELFAERRFGEAQTEADRYLKSYPWDGRAAEVALLRAGLLGRDDGRRREALAAYREILAREAPASVRDDALYGAIVNSFDVGEVAQARSDVTRYLAAFPSGKHRGEVDALRGR